MSRLPSVILGILIFIFLLANASALSVGCENKWYYDGDHQVCQQKQFCGVYLYQGLMTFNSKTDCEVSLESGTNISSENLVNISLDEQMFCTQEAKLCPDNATYVGRNSSNGCRFDKCPNEQRDDDGPRQNGLFSLSNGRKAEIKVMPETASAKAIERLGDLGFNITLTESGSGNETRAVYHLETQKDAKLFGFIDKKAKIEIDIDAEADGKIIIVKRPWWAFLATGL